LHHALNVTPTLKSYTLENGQKSVANVIEVCNAEIRITIGLAAEISTGTLYLTTYNIIRVNFACLDRYASVFEEALKEVGTCDSKYYKEE